MVAKSKKVYVKNLGMGDRAPPLALPFQPYPPWGEESVFRMSERGRAAVSAAVVCLPGCVWL